MSGMVRFASLISACALLVSLVSGPPSTAEASSTARLSATNQPNAPLFGGNCSKLLDPASVASALGTSATTEVDSDLPLVASVGGIDCAYYVGSHDKSTGMVWITIAPAAIANDGAVKRSLSARDCGPRAWDWYDAFAGCRETGAVNGWWYSLSVLHYLSTTKQKSGFDALSAKIRKALAANAAPSQVSEIKPFDCAAVDTGGIAVTSSRTTSGIWESPDPRAGEIYAAALLLAGPVTCRFVRPGGKAWEFTVYPGTASAYEQCAKPRVPESPGASAVIKIAGVKAAFGQQSSDNGPLFCATDGTSTVKVASFDEYDTASFNANQRAFLSTILVAVLAAAS